MGRLKVAIFQTDVAFGEPEVNYRRMERFFREADGRDVDLILMPEMWNTGYALAQLPKIADAEGERTKAFLSHFAKQLKTVIVGGSVAIREKDRFYNTTYVLDATGALIAEYRKIHLFRLMREEKYLTAGNRRVLFSINGVKMGLSICYDLRFPELARGLALEGAEILFLPAEWPAPRMDHWKTLTTARAIENQLFLAAANRVGKDPENQYFGHSLLLNPWGEALAEGGEKEEILFQTIDVAEIGRVRQKIPVFEDRRPDLYFPFPS